MSRTNDSVQGTDGNELLETPHCEIALNLDYDTVVAALCVVMGLFGLVYTFVGYRCIKAVMFLSGLIFGGTVVFVLCQEERILQHSLSFEAIVGISVGIGVLCGFITMLVRYVGLFLQGFFLGLLVAIGAIIALQKFYHPSTPWIPVGILFGTGVLFSLVTLKWQKLFVILSTSVMGAALICTCLEYFMEKFLLLNYIWEALMADSAIAVCWYTWVILGIWPILSLLGCVVQWKFTGKGYDHTDIIIWRGQRKRVRTHLVRHPQRNQVTSNVQGAADVARPRASRSSGTTRSQERSTQPSLRNQSVAPGRCDPGVRDVEPGIADFDTLPPSYDDCVERGVGKPVTEVERSRIIRTKHGSFLASARQSRNSNTGGQGDQISDLNSSGIGIEPSSQPGRRPGNNSRRCGNRPVSSRGSSRGSGRLQNQRPKPNAGSRGGGSSAQGSDGRARASPARRSGGHSRNRRTPSNNSWSAASRGRTTRSNPLDDRQSLLQSEASSRQNSSFRTRHPTATESMMAHARRLRAAQERRENNN